MINYPLDKKFMPIGNFPIIRLGSDGDGGYLVDERCLKSSLLSLGIAGDWSFDQQWLHKNPSAEIHTYDGSIGAIFFVRKVLQAIFKIYKPSLLIRDIKTLIGYFTFLKKKTHFHKLFIGAQSIRGSKSLSAAIRDMDTDEVFLKIDIEGAEYEVLSEIIEHKKIINGLAIEFHDPHKNHEEISKFVDQLNLYIVNTHINNTVDKNSNLDTDPSIEITFSRYSPISSDALIPHPLEIQNDPSCESIQIDFR